MLDDFGHLAPKDPNAVHALEEAFGSLVRLLRFRDKGEKLKGPEVERLINAALAKDGGAANVAEAQLLIDIAEVLKTLWGELDKAAGPPGLQALLHCRPEGTSGRDAVQLLSMGQSPTAENVYLVLTVGRGVLLDEHPWHMLSVQVGRIGDALLAALRPKGYSRPPEPTPDFCLLPGYWVRWKGDPGTAELRPQLHRLFQFLLRDGRTSIPISSVEEAVWQDGPVGSKRISNTISDLNNAMEPICFPWTWRVQGGFVCRDG
jgi:hypothetical protein